MLQAAASGRRRLQGRAACGAGLGVKQHAVLVS